MPQGTADSIEKLMRDFLWGGEVDSSTHLVKWEVIRPKSKGRLEIGNLILRNKSLLVKWLWRFPRKVDMLWHKVIRSKYGIEEDKWLPSEVGNGTFHNPWKAVQGLLPAFLEHAKLKLGNGRRIRFWEDTWEGSEPFKIKYPNIFRLSLLHNKLISDFLTGSLNPEPSWNLHLRRGVSEREMAEQSILLSSLEKVRVRRVLENRWVWEKENSGLFTCKSLFLSLIDKPSYNPTKFYHFIWKILIPNKVKVFNWLLILKKLNTQDLLWRRKPFWSISPSWCVLCRNASESADHLFLHCYVVQKLWTIIIQKFKVAWVLH